MFCPLGTIGLRMINALPSSPDELDAAVAAIAVVTEAYLIKSKKQALLHIRGCKAKSA